MDRNAPTPKQQPRDMDVEVTAYIAQFLALSPEQQMDWLWEQGMARTPTLAILMATAAWRGLDEPVRDFYLRCATKWGAEALATHLAAHQPAGPTRS